MNHVVKNEGFSLIEVMVAMVIAGIALLGTMGAVHLSSRHVQQGGLSSQALEMAQSRLEVKRTVRWESLLEDDLDHDGHPETFMKDDGQGPDQVAGDGIYSAMHERDGVTVVWTIEPDRAGALSTAGLVTLKAMASYPGLHGQRKEVRVVSIRANPTFVGAR